jgi:hypothetical protein
MYTAIMALVEKATRAMPDPPTIHFVRRSGIEFTTPPKTNSITAHISTTKMLRSKISRRKIDEYLTSTARDPIVSIGKMIAAKPLAPASCHGAFEHKAP